MIQLSSKVNTSPSEEGDTGRCTQRGKEKKERESQGRGQTEGGRGEETYIGERGGGEGERGLQYNNCIMLNDVFI